MKVRNIVIVFWACMAFVGNAQQYWNDRSCLIPFRLPIVADIASIEYIDLDNDGQPEILKTTILDSIPTMWIDDDGDMQYGDLEGDTDNDCLIVDRNRDGVWGGPMDLCIDWTDTNNDGIAEIQCVVSNASLNVRNYFDWGADYMYFIDYGEKDRQFNFVDWRQLVLSCWEKYGHSNFFSDYHGNTLFLKMHASTFRIHDLRYSWENPFIFYDPDGDGLSEMAIRCVDTPMFRNADKKNDKIFRHIDPELDVEFTKHIDWAAVTWDLDNDNGQGNEFDFDMTLRFGGKGFSYENEVHAFKNLRGLEAADTLLYDPRWRQIGELVYPDQNVAYEKIFKEGEWDFCWFVYDEDDDCNRWERVELYEPRDWTKIGQENGGVDHNKQADAVGDRGEFDEDNSGKGKLYIAPFDGRLHLYGAEWGIWRIDQGAHSFQGYGGLYPPALQHVRDQRQPEKWASVRYDDTDKDGCIDKISYDLDGDFVFEEVVSLSALGVSYKPRLYDPSVMDYDDFVELHKEMTDDMWNRALQICRIAEQMGVSANWYAFYMQPRTEHERYEYAYWLAFYLYKDMCHVAEVKNNPELKLKLDKAYYSGDWDSFDK